MNVQPAASTSPGQPSPAGRDSETAQTALSSDFQTFLTMLTAQLENQDPLNPVQSNDFAVQLATFSGVEQQVRTNELIEEMLGRETALQLSDAASWIGLEARVPGATEVTGGSATLFPSMPEGADEAVLVVRDASGLERARMAVAVSDEPILWSAVDATGAALPDGFYSFEIETRSDGEALSTDPVEVYARVVEVRAAREGAELVFAGGERFGVDDITSVRRP